MRRLRPRSDAELLAASPEDPDAFAAFYRRHERAVLGCFMHWCRSAELASDLMAETFAAGFESLARYRDDLGEPRAWLFGIARHVLLMSIRRGRVEDGTRRRRTRRRAHCRVRERSPSSFVACAKRRL